MTISSDQATSTEIREKFLDFFRSKEHAIVPSAPIVVKNDPTLLFTNAGMNQFKDYFLGNRKPDHRRVADTQKCLRVSGKHNDLEEVGVDTYHHTMFEMLGNWSFGDYFKKEAIAWSWELLTEVYQLEKSRLYVTIFEGDAAENLPEDTEAYSEWKKYVPESHILRGNKKDNFWEMGDTGPCGPSSEIHMDCRTEKEIKETAIDGGALVNRDHPQVIEIWNNVFIQFNRMKDGRLEPLPEKHVDTGMGFERLVRVIQGKQSNYDTDVFSGTISETEQITGRKYDGSNSKSAIAFRVIADHIRAIAFTIADGQLPSNTGAGYVIRRILRRAVRYYYSSLEFKQPLLYRLIPVVAEQFRTPFPELLEQKELVTKVVKEEEESFMRTLGNGLKRFDNYIQAGNTASPETTIPDGEETPDDNSAYREERMNRIVAGEFAFKLNDTFGFPIDLTNLIAREHGWTVDMPGFEKAMHEQKSRSRAATSVDTGDWTPVHDDGTETKFVGYDQLEIQTRVARYRSLTSKGREQYQIVLQSTPFYAESGGQVGDRGTLSFGSEIIRVTDTKKENNLIVHFTDSLPADIEAPVTASVDAELRLNIANNHTATHLLHAALRTVLGEHVAQKGSLVSSDVLRFDFSHFTKMTDQEIDAVQKLVNKKIRENIPVVIREMPRDEALKLGAMALFGEKYGSLVRVVTTDPSFSIELCGGTHVGFTGMIGTFTVISESAVAAGVRRVEALTGESALVYLEEKAGQVKSISELLKIKDPLKGVEKLMTDAAALEKKIEGLEARHLVQIRNELLQKDEIIAGFTFVGDIVEVHNPESLKKLCYDLKSKLRDYVAVVCANIGGKPYVAIGISETVSAARGLDASKIIREYVAPLIRGGGGGQKTLATAGGQDAGRLQEVIEAVRKSLGG